jgi:cupin 2 domain-containing protein
MKNLFADIPSKLPEELIEVLAENKHVRIERIVSSGHASPDGFWYDQNEAEWVIVLRGEAKLLFEGDEEPIHMRSGDFINIPAHRKHRVEWTAQDEPTVWLAVFYKSWTHP